MLELIRSQQKWLMMVIAILVIAAFAFFYDYNNRPQAAGQGGQPFMKVYGKSYSYQETDRLANSGAVAAQMQFFQLAYTLGGLDQRFGGDDPRLRMLDYAANLVILRESAERLGVAVSDAEVDARREEIRSLQTNGVLDAKKWENFVEGVGRFGYGAVDVYEVIRDQITLEKLTALLGANTPAPDFAAEAQYAYRSEFITASQITFNTEELKKDITATDEEAQAYYDKEKDLALTADELAEIADPEKRKEKMALKTAERRGIDYVFFPHPSEEELKDKSPDEQRKLRNSYATKVNEFFEKTQSMETAEESPPPRRRSKSR
ncbi:MAG: SurA N-terminal domain-containing protein [Verrucomicrobiales bacterium]